MRIAIVTLPFHTNYGGVLQAYALRRVLMEMGHEVSVLALRHGMPLPVWWKAPAVYARRAFMRLLKGGDTPEVFRELRYRRELPVVSSHVGRFVDEQIRPEVINSYGDIKEGQYDAFVVGSDQVWRPRYFGRIEDAFLGFAKGWDVLRVSYAASFGTSELEYSSAQLESCSALLGQFDAVSVREDDAVEICRDWFGCGNAVHVLDPVMLLGRDVYSEIASRVACSGAGGKLVIYILDNDFQKEHVVRFVANAGGMEVYDASVRPYDRRLPVSERVVPPLEHWLACIRDAAFVVTDSFHACVLCILFHKPFIAVGNRARGMARLKSLMEMCALEQRLVHGIDPGDDCRFFLDGPCWDDVDSRVLALRRVSLDFLCGALEK